MKPLEQALNRLPSRPPQPWVPTPGTSKSVCGTLLRFSKPKAPPTSPGNWRFAGPPNPQRRNPPPGLGVWVWSGASPCGTVPSNRAPRFHRGLLPHRYRRKPPHIYSDEEIEKAPSPSPTTPLSQGLRARTYTTLFGSARSDRNAGERSLRSGPSRMLTSITESFTYGGRSLENRATCRFILRLWRALKKYAEVRDRIFPAPLTPAFFISERGSRITEWMARYTFAKLSQQIGLRASAKGHGRGPRLHDMRHRFAARTLIHWYRAGLDVERELPKLATYLGHVHVNDTYWYLEAVPELLQLATDRLIEREVQP